MRVSLARTYELSSRIDPASTDVILLDTSVAIQIWQQDGTAARPMSLNDGPALSIFSWIELEGGVYTHSKHADERRRRLDVMLRGVTMLPFDTAVIRTYGMIVAALGFSRRQILDRLIAATAIVHDLTLVTLNGADFADIPDLRLEVWPAQ